MARLTLGVAITLIACFFAACSARAASDEDAYRRILEGGPIQKAPAVGNPSSKSEPRRASPPESPLPKSKKIIRQIEPKIPCDQIFAARQSDLDRRERYHHQWCTIEEKCTARQNCDHFKKMIGEYITIAKLAAQCPQMWNSVAMVKKYSGGIPAARELAGSCTR